jgi:hypothetical protein
VLCGFYALVATLQGSDQCDAGGLLIPGWRSGGQISSATTMIVMVAALWVVGGAIYVTLGRRGGRLFLICAILNVVALIALWPISPLIWGSRHC